MVEARHPGPVVDKEGKTTVIVDFVFPYNNQGCVEREREDQVILGSCEKVCGTYLWE